MFDCGRARAGPIFEPRDLDQVTWAQLRKRATKRSIAPQTEARIERRRGFEDENLSPVCSYNTLFEVSSLEAFPALKGAKVDSVGRDGNTL